MAIFKCSHCEQSVKKNHVKKHLLADCQSSFPMLTCVNCLKDFRGDEYIMHTSCITEGRTSTKGLELKPPANGGKKKKEKKKQENWISFIQNTVRNTRNLDSSVKRFLEWIANNPAVPRKKNNFLKFCRFELQKYLTYVVHKIWDHLERKRNQFKKLQTTVENGKDRKRKRMDSNNRCSSEFPDNGVTDARKYSPENSRKKEKKKHDVQDNAAEPVNDVGVVDASTKAESKKQKKKNKSNFSNSVHVIDLENCNDVIEGENVIPDNAKENGSEKLWNKKEKEKCKIENYEKKLLEIHNEPVLDAEEQGNNAEETSQKRKKKKEKHLTNCDIKDVKETNLKTVSKKKQKPEQEIEVVKNGEDAEHEEVSDAIPRKFNWEETVVKLLESKGELPLKRVEKKVVNEYINSRNHIVSVEKVVAKFNKKIMKMSRIEVKRETVKLSS